MFLVVGSDLDGDEYTVIFDRNLFFERNEKAMIFQKQNCEDYDSELTVTFLFVMFFF